MKTFEYRIHKKIQEIYSVEPNDLGLGILTNYYKRFTAYLKTLPFIFIIPLSFVFAFVLYFLFGKLMVRLVTILQYGF